MDELSAMVLRTIMPLGMTAAASGMVSGPKAASDKMFHFTNWPSDWLALYVASDFLLADPVPRWARNSGRAVSWSELFRILPERDRGREVIEAGAAFGFTEGFVAPMRAGDNSLGVVSFGGRRGPFTTAELIFLGAIARTAFEAADRIENQGETGQAAPILTAREIECLMLMVRGHADGQIGTLLGLSVRTVRFHLTNAREKFAATSRTHLGALALAQGYVRL
jgi:DNA-binding CsgD family transcriptional regulator